jgi:hypothetical protein
MLEAKQPPGNVGRIFARCGLLPGASGTRAILVLFPRSSGADYVVTRIYAGALTSDAPWSDTVVVPALGQEGDYILADVTPDPVMRIALPTSRDFVPRCFLDACQLSVPRASLLPASKNLHRKTSSAAHAERPPSVR